MTPPVEEAARLIRKAEALVVTAGAGMGVDSGLPDFRGNEGFWRAYPALAEAGIEFTRIANPAAFRSQPEIAWGFYGHRLNLYRATTPHAGFEILQDWGKRAVHGAHVFTSNVDGHFQKAGFAGDRVYECHGSIHHLQCIDGCANEIWSADGFEPAIDPASCRLLSALPLCVRCGRLARPNILMFGDGDWREARSAQQRVRLTRWLREAGLVVVVEMGAGTAVPSVRRFGEALVSSGGRLIRINPREPQVPGGQVGLAMGALEALRAIDSIL